MATTQSKLMRFVMVLALALAIVPVALAATASNAFANENCDVETYVEVDSKGQVTAGDLYKSQVEARWLPDGAILIFSYDHFAIDNVHFSTLISDEKVFVIDSKDDERVIDWVTDDQGVAKRVHVGFADLYGCVHCNGHVYNSNEVAVSIDGWTYGEDANEPEYWIADPTKGEAVVSYWADGEKLDGKPVNAGSYTVLVEQIAADGRSVAPHASCDFTIEKRDTVVSAVENSKVYSQDDPELEWIATNLVDGDTLNGVVVTRAEGEDVGTYEISVAVDEEANPNYNITVSDETVLFTIIQAPACKVKVSAAEDLIANGTAQNLVVIDKEPAEGHYEFSIDGGKTWVTEIPTGTDAGTYTVMVKYVCESGNYENGEPTTLTVTIAAPAPKVTPAKTGDSLPLAVGVLAMVALGAGFVAFRARKNMR